MAQNLSNLPIGAKIKFGRHSVNGETAQDITWLVVAKNHTGYPSNSVTILAQDIVDLRAIDAIEPNNSNADIRSKGNNDYGLSNVDQWLNKDSTSWYVAAHSNDQTPNNTYVSNGTGYDSRPGFLSNFTTAEKNAILTTSINVAKYSYTYETLSRKIFLPSIAEVGLSTTTDGTVWAHFSAATRRAVLTLQCYNNTLSTEKPTSITAYWMWWLRSASYSGAHSTYVIDQNGNSMVGAAYKGSYGVRPALNLSSTLSVSDTTDGDGAYNIIWNSAPPVPTTLTVPTVYGGKSTTISWSSVADPDGHTVTYQLENSINGATYTNIYSGTNLSHTVVIPYGSTSVKFRVRAVDSLGATSGYIESTSKTVNNNVAPTISGVDGSLGDKSDVFTHNYTVTDIVGSSITVRESIDGMFIRSYSERLLSGTSFSEVCSVSGSTWLELANGIHTLTITASDGVDSSTRTLTFVKKVNSFTIQNNTPFPASTRPSRIKLDIAREIPIGATFEVYVCNNGFDSDANKKWENATSSVTGGLVHVFSNEVTPTAGKWGVLIKVNVNRNGKSGACYVSSIGGNWE